jgi:hypothetical protein
MHTVSVTGNAPWCPMPGASFRIGDALQVRADAISNQDSRNQPTDRYLLPGSHSTIQRSSA